MVNTTDNQGLPLDHMAMEGCHQQTTPLSLSITAGLAGESLNSYYLRVVSVEGQEQVSQPYSFTISLRANEEGLPALVNQELNNNFADLPREVPGQTDLLQLVQGQGQGLLGQWGTITLGYQYHAPDWRLDPPLPENEVVPPRYFSGVIASISQSAPGEYTAELQSPLFPSTLRNRYFVYKKLCIADLIKTLLQPELSRYSTTFSIDCSRVQGIAATRIQDWMQAGETDFSMLQRVMKKAAIHFYFIHTEVGVTAIFSNQTTSPNAVHVPGSKNGNVALRYSYTDAESLGVQQGDLFCNLNYKVQMVTQAIGTVLARQEANWETNEVAKYDSFPVSTDAANRTNKESSEDSADSNYLFYKTYSYGVDKEESNETNLQISQQVATQQGTLTGQSTSNLLSPGYTFTLTQVAINPKDDSIIGNNTSTRPVTATNLMPDQFNGKTFVVTKITHKMSQNTPYSGSIEATSVSNEAIASQETFITPFNIQDTHQGSVLATVLESAVPKSAYFFEKANFQTELSSVEFDDKRSSQIGCLVQFATDEGTDIQHWVALSDSSQSAPAVHSTVMVGRGDNGSEIPQIQQVVSSHGSKTIQPALWRNNSWTFNTNWGSSCNTSYGDSMSIHYDSEATPDLKTAMNIIQTAYDNPTVLGANFGGTSYSKGCSFSYSTTEKGAKGLASASVSQGSHFSESYSDQDYSVSYNNTRQSFSKSNKSVNVSYQGPFTETIDEQNLSFINGRIPNQEIIDICDALPDGSTYNQSHVTGKNINLSGTGAPPPSAPAVVTAQSYSHSITHGDSQNISVQVGNTASTSTFDGDKSDTSTVTGDSNSISKVSGDSTSTSLFEGAKSDISTVAGATTSLNTFLGAKSDTSLVAGAAMSMSTFQGAKSDTNIMMGATESLSTFLGVKSDISTVEGDSESTSSVLGNSTSTSNFIGLKEDVVIVNGEDMNSKEKSGITVNVTVLGGVTSENEEHAGVESVSKLGPAGAHTDERIKAIQISVTNITVEGILSIL